MSVSLETSEGIATIQIDDGKKNVINHAVLDELEEAWQKASQDDAVKAIILAGRPGSFCAGYDVSVMTGEDRHASAELGRRGGVFAHALYGSAKPTVAVSCGHAFTIGAVWLACADVRFGEQGPFKYGMTEVALGVPFSDWPLVPLRARLKSEHQISALLHSRIHTPVEALEAGFIDELVAADQGMARAREMATQLAQLPNHAYALTKQRMRETELKVMADDLGL